MKTNLSELAIFGGEPTFSEKLYVGRPNIGDRERFLQRISNILDERWLTNNGPYVQDFEHRIARLVGVKHCIAMCNATIALEIAIRALDLTGEVIVPSFTFIATAHALQWQEITPVFCDINPNTHTIDAKKVEQLITPRTTGIIGVHVWGQPCDTDLLTEIADRHQCKLLFDAAHAFGCSHQGRMIGNFGNAEVFSFHATKFLNSLEGGAVVTNDDELAAKIRLMKNFGFAGYDNVIYIGTNGKMNEVSAAMGITSLESFDHFISLNRENYQHYRKYLSGVPGIKILTYDETENCNYQYIVLEIDEQITRVSRDALIQVLWAENVIARRYFYPGCHRMEPYRTIYPGAGDLLSVTRRISEQVLLLPTGTAVEEQDIDQICQIIRLAIEHKIELSDRLPDDSFATQDMELEEPVLATGSE
jgi:dTDP-4-amino-4,6-dideoxygalactose transaminase